MDVREKLVELILNADNDKNLGSYDLYELTHERTGLAEYFADYLIAHGVTVQEWISVKDRLPEDENQRVLAVCAGDYPIGHPMIDTDRYTRGHWVRYGNDVIHWMPLPQPPKGE